MKIYQSPATDAGTGGNKGKGKGKPPESADMKPNEGNESAKADAPDGKPDEGSEGKPPESAKVAKVAKSTVVKPDADANDADKGYHGHSAAHFEGRTIAIGALRAIVLALGALGDPDAVIAGALAWCKARMKVLGPMVGDDDSATIEVGRLCAMRDVLMGKSRKDGDMKPILAGDVRPPKSADGVPSIFARVVTFRPIGSEAQVTRTVADGDVLTIKGTYKETKVAFRVTLRTLDVDGVTALRLVPDVADPATPDSVKGKTFATPTELIKLATGAPTYNGAEALRDADGRMVFPSIQSRWDADEIMSAARTVMIAKGKVNESDAILATLAKVYALFVPATSGNGNPPAA